MTAALLRLLARLEALQPHRPAVEYLARSACAVAYRALELALGGALLWIMIAFARRLERRP